MRGIDRVNRLTSYEKLALLEIRRWEKEILKAPGLLETASKTVQSRINSLIPDKVHETVTAAVKGIVQTTLAGVDYIPKGEPLYGASLEASDAKAKELVSLYKKLAAAEGAGTGAGGILLGLADFPLLIGIKLKFLFELAHAYGFSTRDVRERLFILYVFQLAFCSHNKRYALLFTVRNWSLQMRSLSPAASYSEYVDWQQLQQEYRDTIDFRKMLQLVPGIGAVVGAWANYGLLDELGHTAINCYRLRKIKEKTEGQPDATA